MFQSVRQRVGEFPLFTLAWIGDRLVQSTGWAGRVKIRFEMVALVVEDGA